MMIMAGAITKRSEDARVPAIAMANKFSRYKPEEEQVVRKAEVFENRTQKQLKDVWKACGYTRLPNADYSRMANALAGLRYSAKDIEEFSLALGGLEGEERFPLKAGVFLSALINNCHEQVFAVHIAHLAEKPDCMGYRNTKQIIVRGDCGNSLGYEMMGGSITVEGNVGHWTGGFMKQGAITVKGNAGHDIGQLMEGGSITIEGDAGQTVGSGMRGGSITVNGDAGSDIGHLMKDGEIRFNGHYGAISEHMQHGRIYHGQELVCWKKTVREQVSGWMDRILGR